MRTPNSYNRVFSEDTPLTVWPCVARILKKTDSVLETVRPIGTRANERFLKTWRQITSFVATARIFDGFTFSALDLASLDTDTLTNDLLRSSWDFIEGVAGERVKLKHAGRALFVTEVCQAAARQYHLMGVEGVERKRPFSPDYSPNR